MKKSRKECFFGLHFDFHAMPGETVGSIIDVASIEEMLDATRPDMVQVDSKGHPGISSYMTAVGTQADGMKMDVLRTWRDLTAKRGIRLYAHHSGLFDVMATALHPEWRCVNAEGVPLGGAVSAFSPYADELLIPQLFEIAAYGVDGAWIDGDEWRAFVDYSDYAKAAYTKETGKTHAPLPGEDGYADYCEFCREGFRRYVARYIAAVKEKYPAFEITSNWMYTHTMPEKRTVPIDFISGDYNCSNAVNDVRISARCILPQHLTWDLMAWGQNARPLSWETRNRSTKEPEQLCQEAAVVLALGGGFQFFNILYGTGGLVQRWAIDGWRQVAAFCREREAYCFGAESAADIAVLYPAYYKDKPLFTGGAFRHLSGFMAMLSDAGCSPDVINEADLSELSRYSAVLIPTADVLRPETVLLLQAFAEAGGTVIADGGAFLPESMTGVRFAEPQTRLVFPDGGGRLACVETAYRAPTLLTAEAVLDCYRGNYYFEEERDIALTINRVGKGKVACLTFALSPVYADNVAYALKTFARRMLDAVGYRAKVTVTGSDYADLTLMKKDGRLLAHLINRAGEHNAVGVRTFREIPPIGPVTVTVRSSIPPRSATLLPEGRPLPITAGEEAGTYECTVERIPIHSTVAFEW